MNRIVFVCVASFFWIALVSAQTPETARTANPIYGPLAKAPRKAAARPNPLRDDPDAVAAGAKLFARHCAECHGARAQGGRKAPSLLIHDVQQSTPGAIFWLLTNGVVRRGMPVWSKLPEPQRWQLVSYIESLSPSSDPASEKPSKKSKSDPATTP